MEANIIVLGEGVRLELLVESDASALGSCDTATAYQDTEDSGSDSDDFERGTGTIFRNSARPCAAAKAWHDCIPSGHLETLETDANALVHAVGTQTFWVGAVDTASCTLEQLAIDVLRFHTQSAGVCIQGVEWWVQVKRSAETDRDNTIGLHFDSDEKHKRVTSEHLPPWISTVTYFGSQGAPTLLLPAVADALGRGVAVSLATTTCPMVTHAPLAGLTGDPVPANLVGRGAFLSHPVGGKHFAFDGRLLHGALADLGPQPDISRTRATLIVNLWPNGYRPAEPQRLPTALASSLSNIDASRFNLATAISPLSVRAASQGPWRIRAIGFIPPTAAIEQCPGWRRMGVGLPFFHPKIAVRNLPSCRVPAPCSLVHAPDAELCLSAAEVVAMEGPIPSFEGCRVQGPYTQHLWSNM